MGIEREPKRAKGQGVKHVYENLRDEILSLALQPGQMLDETTLAERFDMSRSPIREALIRLAGDRLVVTLSNRTTVVAPIDIQSFPKYIEALDVAQRMTIRLAAELRTGADLKTIAQRLDGFNAALKSGDHLAMSLTNKQFHVAIANAGKNPYLADFYDRLLDQGRRMQHLLFNYVERADTRYLLVDEHVEMLDAIRDRDVERADALAHAHTRLFRDNFLDLMKENHLDGVRLDKRATVGPIESVDLGL